MYTAKTTGEKETKWLETLGCKGVLFRLSRDFPTPYISWEAGVATLNMEPIKVDPYEKYGDERYVGIEMRIPTRDLTDIVDCQKNLAIIAEGVCRRYLKRELLEDEEDWLLSKFREAVLKESDD